MKQSWKFVLVAGVCAWSLTGLGHSLKMETPADGALVTQFHPVQEMLVRLSLDDWKKLIAQDTIAKYWRNEVKSFPRGVRLDWSVQRTDNEHLIYLFEYGRDPELLDAVKVFPPHSEHTLYNLYLGETYYYRVSLLKDDKSIAAQTPVCKFTVEMLPPRVIHAPGIDNIRDLGGYPAMDGKRLKQGMIYRSTGLNANSSDGGKTPGKPRFTEAGKRVLLDELKFKTELDLRWANEIAGMKTSPLGESVTYINNPSTLYAGAFTAEGKEIYAKSFRIFTDPANYPVNFHCIAGSDRTGTLAYLLEAVLGVPEEFLQKDYVFTSFYATRNFQYLAPIPNSLAECGKPGESALEQAERYWLSAGITPDEIQKFRDIMLGKGTKPDAILLDALRCEAIKKELAGTYTLPVENAKVVPYPVFRRSGNIAGKTLSCALPLPGKYAADWKKSADGGYAWHLANSGTQPVLLAIEGTLSGKADARYYLGERLSAVWFKSPSGQAEWTLEELSKLNFIVPKQGEMALTAVPAAAMAKPENLAQYCFVTEKDAEIPIIPVTEVAEAPTDATWAKVPVQRCSDVFGKALPNAPAVQLAMNREHSILYLNVQIPDATPVAKLTGEQAKVWSEDSVEIFLAESRGEEFFQLVLGRSGGSYVEWGGAWKSRPVKLPAGTQFKVAEVDGGWTLQLVLPFSELDFKSFPRFNVCGGDRPSEVLFNLAPSLGSFHDAERMGVWEFR